MRKSACPFSRWFCAVLALSVLTGVLAACGGPSPAGGDREPVAIAPEPTSTVPPLEATATPGASALPVVAVQAPVSGENGSTSNAGTSRLPAPQGNAALPNAANIDPGVLLAAFEEVLYDIYERALPSVVYIRVPNPAAVSLQRFQNVPDELLWGAGSGFVWDAEGHIVTNHHVVEEVVGTSEEVTIIFADSTQARGRVVGSDPHSDLAVIKLRGGGLDLQPVTLADSSEVRVGHLAVAHRRAVRAGIHHDLRHRQRRWPQHWRPGTVHHPGGNPDRRRHQPGQLRRPAARPARPGNRYQCPDYQPLRQLLRRGDGRAGEHREAGCSSVNRGRRV